MSSYEITIKPRTGWSALDFQELWLGRELLFFLIWRDVKIRYRQTLLGGLWAVLQPLCAMLIFTVVFHNIAGIESNGAPYPLFAFAGLTAWTFFANAVSGSSSSLIMNPQMVSKIYFPRIFIPLGVIGALIIDLLVSLLLMAGLMLYYRWSPSITLLWLPVFVGLAFLSAAGLSLLFSALNVRYRDVKYAVPFFVQMGLFVTPVIYPMNHLPRAAQMVIGLNPMAGVVEGFRYALLGTTPNWNIIVNSTVCNFLLLVAGLFVFRRMERFFADII